MSPELPEPRYSVGREVDDQMKSLPHFITLFQESK